MAACRHMEALGDMGSSGDKLLSKHAVFKVTFLLSLDIDFLVIYFLVTI